MSTHDLGREQTRKMSTLSSHGFSLPHEVIEDPSLSLSQKQEILSQWASDACSVESHPTLRLLPGTNFPVTYSAIMDARKELDRLAESRNGVTAAALARSNIVALGVPRCSPDDTAEPLT